MWDETKIQFRKNNRGAYALWIEMEDRPGYMKLHGRVYKHHSGKGWVAETLNLQRLNGVFDTRRDAAKALERL